MKTYENYDDVIKELDGKDKKKREVAALQFQSACKKLKLHFLFAGIREFFTPDALIKEIDNISKAELTMDIVK